MSDETKTKTNSETMKTYKLARKSSTNEWIVREYVNGKLNANADYFTDDKQDAIDTMAHLVATANA